MDFFYFLVTKSEDWENHFHQNFFNTQGGFLWGFVGALIIGVIVACVFYFGFCNSNKTQRSANIGTWFLSMLICAVVSYFYADLGVIGDSATKDKKAVFRVSFYQANNNYFNAIAGKSGTSETIITDLNNTLHNINDKLDKGKDVRFEYDITTAALGVLFFFLTSIIVKRFTINGKTIPFLKP